MNIKVSKKDFMHYCLEMAASKQDNLLISKGPGRKTYSLEKYGILGYKELKLRGGPDKRWSYYLCLDTN